MLTALVMLILQLPPDQQPLTIVETVQDLVEAKVPEAAPVGIPLLGQEDSGGHATNYCQATPNSFGTTARIGCTGSLALDDGSFTLTVTGCPPVSTSFGMFTFGESQYNAPFGNGYLCVSPFNPGIFRMAVQSLGPAMLTCSMLSRPSEFDLFEPGSSWNFQFWYRNPAALTGGAPSTFNLSDGLHVEFAPSPSL